MAITHFPPTTIQPDTSDTFFELTKDLIPDADSTWDAGSASAKLAEIWADTINVTSIVTDGTDSEQWQINEDAAAADTDDVLLRLLAGRGAGGATIQEWRATFDHDTTGGAGSFLGDLILAYAADNTGAFSTVATFDASDQSVTFAGNALLTGYLEGVGIPVSVGSGSPGVASATDDLFVTGALEVDGQSRLTSKITCDVNNGVVFSNGGFMIDTRSTNQQVTFGVLNTYNQLILCTRGQGSQNFDHAPPSNPTFFIQSATAPDTNNTEWLSLAHDQTDGVISVGTGVLKFANDINMSAGQRVETTHGTGATLTASNYYYGVNDTSVARTVTLPASHTDGQVHVIMDESGAAGTNNITIATADADTINGAASATISANYGYATVISDGTNWYIMG